MQTQDFENLYSKAYQLAQEIRDGKWNHLPELKIGPAGKCRDIMDELQNRCPGFSETEYQETLAKALHDSK
jgi:hypothetical protein